MPKRYFATKKKEEPRLSRIIAILVILLALGYGALHAYQWLGSQPDESASSVQNAWEALDKAEELIQAQDFQAALNLLEESALDAADATLAPKASLIYARAYVGIGNQESALAVLKSAMQEFPTSTEYPQIATQYAKLLDSLERHEESAAIFEKLKESAPPEMAAPAIVAIGQQAEREGDLVKALGQYQEALWAASPNSANWREALDALGKVNVNLIFSRGETPSCKYYTVESGDNLTNIGIKLNTTQGLLTRANGITDPSKLRLSQRLKYTPKDFYILIERSTCRLFLVDNEGIFKRYFTGLGMPGHETVLGEYTIGNKQKGSHLVSTGGGPVPPGDPANELGTRWMPLVPSAEGLPTDLGIHGTIHPETIGQYKSHGCPRMKKEDVEELYDLVVRSTNVRIVDVLDWEAFQNNRSFNL